MAERAQTTHGQEPNPEPEQVLIFITLRMMRIITLARKREKGDLHGFL
jgi:hypothetical protein